jgi:prepilin-type N-terminal cleavage/methylation domain-containing protein/prepilin-type processing-associated H-X9-DG protein
LDRCVEFRSPHRRRRDFGQTGAAFTLIELLVVIAIVALLAGILLPSLNGARQTARKVYCATNLRSLGQGLYNYAGDFDDLFPAAYLFNCDNYFPAPGITHFSALLQRNAYVPEKAFHCPSFARGGLPPTDTTADNLEPGQSNNETAYLDRQAIRCAYTLNEALCPQPYFLADPPPHTPMGMMHYVGSTNVDLHGNRLYRRVRTAQVDAPAATILATEWQQDWRLVAGPAYSNPNALVSLSYRPVHGFAPLNGNSLDPFDVSLLPPTTSAAPQLRRLCAADLASRPAAPGWRQPRLNWIGRNHDRQASTNFLYVDGHVETKILEQTVTPFEWGQKFYSLRPGDDIADSL